MGKNNTYWCRFSKVFPFTHMSSSINFITGPKFGLKFGWWPSNIHFKRCFHSKNLYFLLHFAEYKVRICIYKWEKFYVFKSSEILFFPFNDKNMSTTYLRLQFPHIPINICNYLNSLVGHIICFRTQPLPCLINLANKNIFFLSATLFAQKFISFKSGCLCNFLLNYSFRN